VWVASHAAASRPGGAVDSGGIVAHGTASGPAPVPGSATDRAVLRVTGPVREVAPTDRRVVTWERV
jgi:beta-glucosidase